MRETNIFCNFIPTNKMMDKRCTINNRVGGKRSSFLPTFVFRPLTPPYVRFSYTAVP
jgi:hypothetical protein